jgi:hypothetical protein
MQSTNPGEFVLTNVQGVKASTERAVAFRCGFQLALLVLNALPIGADPDVESNPLVLAHG